MNIPWFSILTIIASTCFVSGAGENQRPNILFVIADDWGYGDAGMYGNRIVKSRMAAVLISPEFWWMEAGTSSDVVVKDNIIEGCLQTPIQVLAPGGDGRPLPAGAHRNISILNNRFENCAWPLIHVTSTSGLSIKDNRFPHNPSGNSDDRKPGSPEPVLIENCDNKP